MHRFAAALVATALFAGCLGESPAEEPRAAPDVPALSASKPTFTKLTFATDATDPATAVTDALGQARARSETLAAPGGTGQLQLAIDLAPPAAPPDMEARVLLLDAGGATLYETPFVAAQTKFIGWVPLVGGDYELRLESRGAWTVGVVAVFTPTDYTPGIQVNVSFPEQREVDHTFQPSRIEATAGAPTRITLMDYDPHAGTANLQHNLVLPDLEIATEGRTTWGEVRVLDFTAPATAGEHEFYCEFHEQQLRGTLVVR